jgi:hypothetical protein
MSRGLSFFGGNDEEPKDVACLPSGVDRANLKNWVGSPEGER